MRKLFVSLFIVVASSVSGQVQPELFAPDVISTHLDELNAAFTPDGKTVYYSITTPGNKLGVIVYSELKGSRWSQPKIASFSGQFVDYDPFITADGSRLYYCSNQTADGKPKPDADLFYVERTANGWGQPKSLGPNVNDDKNQYYPTLAANGNLYFNSNYDGNYDLYVSRLSNGEFQKPEKLKGKVNDKSLDGDAIISPDEKYIIFASYGRPEGLGSGDLYISFQENGEWTQPKNLGAPINSVAREYCPILSPDGKKFYFTSFRGPFDTPGNSVFRSWPELQKLMNSPMNGLGNVYSVDIDQLLKK